MSLFDEPIRATLNAAELETFHAVTVRDESGGAQDVYHWLAARLRIGPVVVLEDAEIRKLRRYAYAYGDGGYQQAFRAVLRAVRRAGWNDGDEADVEPRGERPGSSGKAWDGGSHG
jgi:hypothetical protein